MGSGKVLIKSVAILGAALLALAACGSTEGEKPSSGSSGSGGGGGGPITTKVDGHLTIGSDIPYPPFEFRKGGKLAGLDIDLAKEIAKRLHLTVADSDITDTSFTTIFSQLAGGRYDVVVAASTITPEREKEVNFSIPYYNAQQSLTVQKSSGIKTIDDLKSGDVVGVQNGTTGKDYAEAHLASGVDIRSFPQGPDGYTSLEAGQVDAVINDEPTALAEVANRPGLVLAQRIDTGEHYGIAVDPSNKPLLEAINKALKGIIKDGAYAKIYARYSGLPPGGSVAKGS